MLTPMVSARPGTTVPCTVRVHNDGTQALSLAVRVVGLGPSVDGTAVPWEPLAPGGTLDVEVAVAVPEAMTPGEHAVAIEVAVMARAAAPTDHPRAAPGRAGGSRVKPTVALAPLVVKVASLDQVLLRTLPSVVRGRSGARFSLEVINTRHDDVVVDLAAAGATLEVALDPSTVSVAAGATTTVQGRVRAPRMWRGEERQHVVNVEGSGSANPTYTRLVFRQRPVIARGIRGVAAVLVVLSLWVALLGGAALWVVRSGDDDAPAAQELIDTDGDGVPDSPLGPPGGAEGGTAGGAEGEAGSDAAGPDGTAPGTDPSATQAPTATLLRGVVKAGATGDDGGIVVTLTPLVSALDDQAAPGSVDTTDTASAASAGFGAVFGAGAVAASPLPEAAGSPDAEADGSTANGKFWSARHGTYAGNSLTANRATVSVTAGTDADGAWLISDVPLRRSYEVSFSKPGFDRQSFQVTPLDDGSPLELEVELQPASGALGGIITGPDGGLGGVDLTVTDGTLTFATTTSTAAGDTGEWIIEGLSTPATYTVTATAAGFGTAVAQLSLSVGERLTGLSFAMRNGVGSIGGMVRGSVGPIGGVTLTATGEGVTRTTTSLTAGATGSYLFPDLEVPGTYTVTASAPGFITQTRLVELTGNAVDIDVELVRTTASITGVVTSISAVGATDGLPLPNASIEIDVDSLRARATTAVAPDAGSFTLVDLPPGTYTVAFGRYDHLPDSRLVTLTAGQVLDLGKVPLVYQPRAQLNPTGSLSVTVQRATPIPLGGATLVLTDVAKRLPQLTQVLGPLVTSFKFESLPVGVYDLQITRPDYRPQVVQRVAIGLVDVPLTVNLLRFGQAFGQVIDGLAPQETHDGKLVAGSPLNDYRLLVYKALGPSLVCEGSIEVLPGAVETVGSINWEVGLNLQLLSGSYVLRFTQAPGDTNPDCSGGDVPPGFAAVPDPAGNVAAFEVPAEGDDPIRVPDISVFPYPRLSGVVLAPTWDGTAVALDPATALIDGLSVTLRCGALTTAAALTVVDGVSVTFLLDRESVADMFESAPVPPGGSLGTCSIVASATDSVTVDAAIPTPLTIPTSGAYDDRALAIVMADDPDDLVGVTGWIDAGTSTLNRVGGAIVGSDGVTVGFGVSEGTDTDGPGIGTVVAGPPGAIPGNITATSAVGTGLWSFTQPGQQQVADESTYDVTLAAFQPATFTLLIDEGVRTITGSTGLAAPVTATGTLDLRLQPLAGSITGDVQVLTAGSTDRRGEALVHATPPGGVGADVAVNAVGRYVVDPAMAGTWLLDYRTEPGSNLVAAPTQLPATVPVDPDEDVVVADAQYWELAQVDVEFRDAGGATVSPYPARSPTYPLVAVTQAPAKAVYPTWADRAVQGDADGLARLALLPVDAADPTAADTIVDGRVGYRLAVEAPGFDISTTTYEVFEEGNPVAIGSGTDASAIDVLVKAGSRLKVVLGLPAYGAITGTVTGLLKPPSTLPADVEQLLPPDMTVVAQRVADLAGTPLPSPPAPEVLTSNDATGFRFDLPSGFYQVTYNHPDFISLSKVYEVGVDEVVDGSADIEIARSTFRLTVLTDTVSDPADAAVAGATVRLWPAGTSIAATATLTPSYEGVTDADGVVVFSPTPSPGNGLIPGGYLLMVRKADVNDATRDGWFPVIATITAPRGADEAARTLTRRAVMPQTQGSLVGTVSARNNDGRPVPLPAALTIRRSFTVPQAGGADGLPNDATEADQVESAEPAAFVTPATGATTAGYTFLGLAGGVHTLTFDPVAGYDDIADRQVTADQLGPTTVADVEYVAQDRIWRVSLTAGNVAVTGLTVKATHTATGERTATEDPDEAGTYVFTGVPPEVGAYTLVVTSLYHRVTTPASLSVVVEPGATAKTTTIGLTPLAIIEGSAFKRLTETTQEAYTVTDGIELVDGTDTVVQRATADADGGYSFVVEATDALQVRASASGFTPAVKDVGTITLGTTVTAPTLNLLKYATAAITVGGTPGGTATVVASPAAGVTVVEAPPGVFSVSGLDPDTLYTFEVSAPGFASRTLPATGSHDPTIGGTYAESLVLEALRTIGGTVQKGAAAVGGASVQLMQGTDQIDSLTAAADGTFQFTGVTYGTYTIKADKVGSGTGTSASVEVAIGGGVALTGKNVPITNVRPLTYQFSISPVTTPAIVPTITFAGVPGTAGQVSFAVNEDVASLAYTVRAPGYLTRNGSASLPAVYAATANPVLVTLTANTVSGTVTGLTGGATVYLCLFADTTCVASPFSQVGVSSSTSPNFAFATVPPGAYKVVVRKGGNNSPDTPVNVDALTGAMVEAPLSIPAPVPPTP